MSCPIWDVTVNTRYLDDEVWLHVADYNGDGIAEGVESVVDPYLTKRVPMRDLDTG